MYAVFSFYWAVWVVFLYEITFGLRPVRARVRVREGDKAFKSPAARRPPPLIDFSIEFLGKIGEEIERNLINQRYFQFFGVNSSLK